MRRILLMLAALLPILAPASAEGPGEYEVKAAFIHNIVKFVDWPAPPSADVGLRLCILGNDPFGSAIGVLGGKAIGGLEWKVTYVNYQANLGECRVLFISASEAGNLRRIVEKNRALPVLTVGDTAGYAEQGVMVNFYLEANRVRLEVNPEAAARAGLKLGSQLIKLARIVRDAGGPP